MDSPGRDEECEDRMYQIIYGRANPPEDAGGEDGVIGDDYSSQFLNDSSERVQQEEICRELY